MDLIRLADIWEENQEYLKQCLGVCNSTLYGARWVLMPEAPYPRFNHVSRIRVSEQDVPGLIVDAQRFFQSQGISYCTLMTTPATQPSNLAQWLADKGFQAEDNPVMVRTTSPLLQVNPLIRVERTVRSQADVVFELIRQVFFTYGNPTVVAAGRRGVEIGYDIGAISYLAYVGDRPVGTGMLLCHGGIGGIYNMCTLPEYRGCGVATAVLASCVADAYRAGYAYVGLTPTDMGRPLYQRMGFREIYQERYMFQRLSESSWV